jgi:CRISPR-associated endonuclease Cas2
MYWIVTYDVPATHDKWREQIAKVLFSFGLFRIQYSVFLGDRTSNTIDACRTKLDTMLKANNVPADIRFFPMCKSCEAGALRINIRNYRAGEPVTGVPSSILIT